MKSNIGSTIADLIYRNCSMMQMMRELASKFPKMSLNEIKKIVMGTTRIRYASKYRDIGFCSGLQEKLRRKSQIERGFIVATKAH